MGNQGNQQLAITIILVVRAKQRTQNRQAREPRKTGDQLGILDLHQPAQQTHFPLTNPNIMRYLLLTDHRLGDVPYFHVGAYVRDFELDVEGDLVTAVNLRHHIHIDADLGKTELCTHQGTDADADTGAKSSAETTSRIRNLISDAQGCLLAIDSPDLRLLQDTRRAVAQKRLNQRAGNSYGVVADGNFRQAV